MDASPTPRKSNLTLVIVLVIIVIVAASGIGYYLYQGSLQPNIQVVNLQFGSAQTNPQTSTVQDQGRVSGSGSFSYTASVGGLAYLEFDNSFSTFSSKSVSVEYSVAGVQSSQSFTIGAGSANTIGVSLNGGQTVSGTFTASGGSGNDVDFSIVLTTCSQTIPFTANLVNSGGANGYAVISLQIQSSSNVATTGGPSTASTSNTAGGSSGFGPLVQNGTVFSDKYYVEKGQQVPISGSATVLDCGSHAFTAVVSQQQKA
jgi:flagellar basal body-associated protein FliL